ncbi:MAG: hypothetical protein CM15mP68_4660 [Pseudomonadota bacterium]|nr:MAG: hypothetical protein CM15mP68_4660 [Pseudomonadota bacterium]
MQANNCVNTWVVQHPSSIISFAPPSSPLVRLLRQVENKLDGARQLLAHTGKDFSSTHKNRHMVVVAAGVHNTHFPALVFATLVDA